MMISNVLEYEIKCTIFKIKRSNHILINIINKKNIKEYKMNNIVMNNISKKYMKDREIKCRK